MLCRKLKSLKSKKFMERSHVLSKKVDKNVVYSGIFGLAIGDAIGVPFEFKSRESLKETPISGMTGNGTHKKEAGTWSDDTSLTLATADCLSKGRIDYHDIMTNFAEWLFRGKYSIDGAFDVGHSTKKAIMNFIYERSPLDCGGEGEWNNGNGALMRILPEVLYCIEKNDLSDLTLIDDIGRLTHAHAISIISCGIYACVVKSVIQNGLNNEAINIAINSAIEFYSNKYADQIIHFERIRQKHFSALHEDKIKSSGYVLDTLEASVWCLQNSGSYEECVLKAVGLGDDTDTVAAIAGSLAGLAYGIQSFPRDWLTNLRGLELIADICEGFSDSFSN